MAKRGNKAKPPKTKAELAAEQVARDRAEAAAIGVTYERFMRDDWSRESATVRKGAKVEHPPRRTSRIARFLKDGWIDKAGQVALERYEALAEIAAHGCTRSCLDMTPKGDSAGDAPPAVARARIDLARIRNLISVNKDSADALTVTHELLFGLEPAETIMGRLLAGGRDAVRARGKAMVALTAASLHTAFDTRIAA